MSTAPVAPLPLDERAHVLVLTGAGVSAESGVPTFRAAGGLWGTHRVERVASPDGFADDPLLVWRFYSERRRGASSVTPNPGHAALAALEERLGDRFLLVTQNVDGLHQRAGSRRVVELHGNLFETRCSRCDRQPFPDSKVYETDEVPACGACHERGEFALLRPNIVWFGESLDPARLATIDAFAQRAARAERFVFLAVGTSGAVYPAASLVNAAGAKGADTWLVNDEPAANTGSFDHFVRGKSGEVLPLLFPAAPR